MGEYVTIALGGSRFENSDRGKVVTRTKRLVCVVIELLQRFSLVLALHGGLVVGVLAERART